MGLMKLLTEPEKAYAAGLFDGRLRFRIDTKRGVELRLPHPDAIVTQWLAKNLGGKRYCVGNSYEWRLYNKREIATVLNEIQPFMMAKQSSVRKARDICTLPRRKAAKG